MKNSRGFLKLVARSAVFAFALSLAATAHAAPVTIMSYDVAQTPRSGFGCWSHDYSGTIVDTGRTISAGVVCSPDRNQIANYSDGSGTLNDGVSPTSVLGTRLFNTSASDDGQPLLPTITLHRDGRYFTQSLHIFGGDIAGNAIPDALDGLTVNIVGNFVSVSTDSSRFLQYQSQTGQERVNLPVRARLHNFVLPGV